MLDHRAPQASFALIPTLDPGDPSTAYRAIVLRFDAHVIVEAGPYDNLAAAHATMVAGPDANGECLIMVPVANCTGFLTYEEAYATFQIIQEENRHV